VDAVQATERPDLLVTFQEINALTGLRELDELERRFS